MLIQPEVEDVKVKKARREERLVGRLRAAWGGVLGVAEEEINAEATFFELGVDSLLLIQISKLIRDEFQVRIPFRRLLEEFTTIVSLAKYLDQQMPQEEVESEAEGVVVALRGSVDPSDGKGPKKSTEGLGQTRGQEEVARNLSISLVVRQQLELMTEQLATLRGMKRGAVATREVEGEEDKGGGDEERAAGESGEKKSGKVRPEPFVPHQPICAHAGEGLTERQQRHLRDLIRNYNQRTAKSKEHVQRYRNYFADNRALQGFRLRWKELVYPIVGQRSKGAHIWDVDGNEYVDLTMGFGVHLFGHSPGFVVEAMKEQIEKGMQLGPQSYLAGKVAQSISEMTGMPRVTFCNSGTEAVMAALRLARLATGRDKVAMFVGSYHGTFDGNLARLERTGQGQRRTVPAGPGTPASMTDDVMMLYYDEMESLELIRKHGHELAAVLVEPVQSRCPEVQPREFLHELRRVTEHTGAALIFDDMVTGFRIHPGGTQAWFDVHADMATYGKVVAGGMPIGVVAGQGRFLDGIDGGPWNYGDNSYPVGDQIIFAGTFCKHPLTMAACDAVLTHLQQSGPELQEKLNARAGKFAGSLNHVLESNEVPLRVTNCGSLLRFQPLGNPAHLELFFYHLLDQGVFVWEGRTAFLSTAHSDEDLKSVLRAVEHTIAALKDGDFLPDSNIRNREAPATSPAIASVTLATTKTTAPTIRTVVSTEQQKQLWVLAQMQDEASCAYNESVLVNLPGPLDAGILRRALRQVIDRHEALRTVFSADGEHQLVLSEVEPLLTMIDVSHDPNADASKSQELKREVRAVFDLSRGPLLRTALIKVTDNSHVLAITAHHSIFDGWSGGTFLRDLSAHYLAEHGDQKLDLPEPLQFFQYVDWQATQNDIASMKQSRRFWLDLFADSVPLLELPTDYTRPPVYTHAGAQQRMSYGAELQEGVNSLSKRCGVTLFALLLSAYTVLLSRLSRQQEFIVGIHSAGQALAESTELVGNCINLLPLRCRVNPETSFLNHVNGCTRSVMDAHEHQLFPYNKLIKDLRLPRDPRRLTMIETVFDLESADHLNLFGQEVELDSTPTGYTKWDLAWNVGHSPADLKVKCDYNSDLFSAERMRHAIEDYEGILSLIVRQPEMTIASVLEEIEMRTRRRQGADANALKATNLERLKKTRRPTVAATGT